MNIPKEEIHFFSYFGDCGVGSNMDTYKPSQVVKSVPKLLAPCSKKCKGISLKNHDNISQTNNETI